MAKTQNTKQDTWVEAQQKPAVAEQKPASIQLLSLQQIKTGIFADSALAMFKDSLPKALGKEADEVAKRFAKNIYTYVCQNHDLQSCTLPSIIRAACLAASLNLDIDPRGLAYLVPFWNRKVTPHIREAQFQIGYQGLIDLAYRSTRVLDVSAHCIYESEKGGVKITRTDGRYKVEHPFSYEKPTGNVIASYATAEIEGFGARTMVLRIDEIERLRSFSPAPDSPAWKNHYEAMCKKTVIRQLAKFLPKSIMEDFSKAAALDEEQDFVHAAAAANRQIAGDMGTQPVDTQFEPTKAEMAEPAVDGAALGKNDFLSDEGLK